jgi:hypothetical protein
MDFIFHKKTIETSYGFTFHVNTDGSNFNLEEIYTEKKLIELENNNEIYFYKNYFFCKDKSTNLFVLDYFDGDYYETYIIKDLLEVVDSYNVDIEVEKKIVKFYFSEHKNIPVIYVTKDDDDEDNFFYLEDLQFEVEKYLSLNYEIKFIKK